jgi:erythromycin esterase
MLVTPVVRGLLAVIVLLAVLPARSSTADAQSDKSLGGFVYPIQSMDSTDFADLQFLEPILRSARIVQLGENGHGAAEAMRVRARIARFLHQRLGFTVLAFESSLFLCHAADAAAAAEEPRRTLTRSLVGVWHTEEVLPLFTYMRETRGSGRPLRLAGFDVQPIGGARKERPAFFERVVSAADPEYGRTARDLDLRFNAEYEKGSASRRAYFRANAADLVEGYQRLAAFLETHRSALQERLGREVPLVARQEATSMSAYVRQQAASSMTEYAEVRDKAMADNLTFIAEELFPDRKVIVWGHNYHLRHDNASIPPHKEIFPGVAARSMGSWVRERYGTKVFTIGQYEVEGQALDNSRQPYAITRPPEGSLERRLHAPASPLVFIDIRAASRRADGAWLRQSVPARYNGQHAESMVPVDQYDGILLIAKVSPPKFLY